MIDKEMESEGKKMGIGPKLGLFVGFIAVWLGMAFFLQHNMSAFEEGGWGMWPILMVGIVSVAIIVERIRYLFFVAPLDTEAFQANVQKELMSGNVQGALEYCSTLRKPLPRIVAAGLSNLHRPDVEVQEAVDETALMELPKVEIRTGYLAMIGNIATLLGLLGTIVGLIKSFAGVSLGNPNDPATVVKAKNYVHLVSECQGLTQGKAIAHCIEKNKATILAKGISEAMNCTAFGLGVGITALLGFSVLNGRTQNMLDDISDTTVYVMNLAVGNRDTMRLS